MGSYLKFTQTVSKNALPTALIVAYTFLPTAVGVIFKTRSCEEFDDGSSLLREDYSVSCLLPAHTSMLWFTWFMGMFWIPLPVLFAVLLWTHRYQIKLN